MCFVHFHQKYLKKIINEYRLCISVVYACKFQSLQIMAHKKKSKLESKYISLSNICSDMLMSYLYNICASFIATIPTETLWEMMSKMLRQIYCLSRFYGHFTEAVCGEERVRNVCLLYYLVDDTISVLGELHSSTSSNWIPI